MPETPENPPQSPVHPPSLRRSALFAGLLIGVTEAVLFMIERPVRDRSDRIKVAMTILCLVPGLWTLIVGVLGMVFRIVAFIGGKKRIVEDAAFFAIVATPVFLLVRGLLEGEWIARQEVLALALKGTALVVGVVGVVFRRWLLRRHASPVGKIVALAALCVAIGAYWADRKVLVALYPGGHALLFLVAAVAATIATSLLPWSRRRPSTAFFLTAGLFAVLGVASFVVVIYPRPDLVQRLVDHTSASAKLVEILTHYGLRPGKREELSTERFLRIARNFNLGRTAALSAKSEPLQAFVLVTLEATRPDHLGFAGYSRATSPNLDRFAAGARFTDDAWTTANQSHHALVSLLSGLHRGGTMPEGREIARTFNEWKEIGVRTVAVFPKGGMLEHQDLFGEFDAVHAYADGSMNAMPSIDRELAGAGLRKLFIWIHLIEPHAPYEPPAEYKIFGGSKDIDLYDGEILAMDAAFGQVVQKIEKAWPKKNIVTAVTADHGEAFGEHGVFFHKTGLHEEQVRVPLLISGPGVLPGKLPHPASHVDILPTAAVLLGWPLPAGLDGRDLLNPRMNRDNPAVFARHENAGVAMRVGSLKMNARTQYGLIELFDLDVDPGERSDVAAKLPHLYTPLFEAVCAFDHGPGGLMPRTFGEAAIAKEAKKGLESADPIIRRFCEAYFNVRK